MGDEALQQALSESREETAALQGGLAAAQQDAVLREAAHQEALDAMQVPVWRRCPEAQMNVQFGAVRFERTETRVRVPRCAAAQRVPVLHEAARQGLEFRVVMQVGALIIRYSWNISVCNFTVRPPRSGTLCGGRAAHQEAPAATQVRISSIALSERKQMLI